MCPVQGQGAPVESRAFYQWMAGDFIHGRPICTMVFS